MIRSIRSVSTCLVGVSLGACAPDRLDTTVVEEVGAGGQSNHSGGASVSSGGAAGSYGMQQTGGNDSSESWGLEALGGSSGSELLFAPERVSFNELTDANEGVNVVAATLIHGAIGLEFYAALKNDGDSGACSGAMAIELFDEDGFSLGAFNGGIFAAQDYRVNDLNLAVSCVDPEKLGMIAIVNIDASLSLEQVAHVIYRFTYFNTEFFEGGLSSLDDVLAADAAPVRQGEQEVFVGSFRNDLEVKISDPSVTVFPVNEVGRPLGMVRVARSEPIEPGNAWMFQTTPVANVGNNQFTFLTGSIAF